MSELARIMEYGLCYEDVTRKGESQPCEKTAVAVRIDSEDNDPYPVCAYHARGKMVPLPALRAAGEQADEDCTCTGLYGDGIGRCIKHGKPA